MASTLMFCRSKRGPPTRRTPAIRSSYVPSRTFHCTARPLNWSKRISAINDLKEKKPVVFHTGKTPLESITSFGEDVFGEKEMREKLAEASFNSFRESVENGKALDPAVADQIAVAMKDWAVSKGATHYTHWFQPLTGLTAEKHDSFITYSGPSYDRRLILNFSGKELIKGEPDASSFPSGGLRSTFEARGYTAWDMTSPSFVRKVANGAFLCIPTAFCSWTGEVLDVKTPLLRSIESLSKSTTRLMNLIGFKNVKSAFPELGIEQEFFLVDRGFYYARPDLITCGRTLLGDRPPKGQELEDHYFGTVDRRVLSYIQDVEYTLWKLGVPLKTRHNEVAPAQYEVAPIYGPASLAADQNMLTMEVLRETARHHGFACLLHEKPFAYVNGSGKHNNYTVATNTGMNLMAVGNTPEQNLRFMLVLSAIFRALYLHGDLLRIGVTTPGNDHRLGACEAPPAIMSIFVGSQLEEVVNEIVNQPDIEGTSINVSSKKAAPLQLGIQALPPLPRDASDRNRTSPFAYTGNKFEFRAVGSSQTSARPAMILNTILSESFDVLADEIEGLVKKGIPLQESILKTIQKNMKKYHLAMFNGNNYSQEWHQEAARRKLWNLATAPEALQQLLSEKNAKLFAKTGVLSERELPAYQEVFYHTFSKALAVEASTLLSMASTSVLPVAFEHQTKVNKSVSLANTSTQQQHYSGYQTMVDNLINSINHLRSCIEKADQISDPHHQATFYRQEVYDAMTKTRSACDQLESMTEDSLWPFAKYSEILFMR